MDILMQLGFKRSEALVLVALEEGCRKAKEIVSKYGIRQADVSEALRSLIKKGFVKEVGKLKEHKVGRPVKLYSLTSDLNAIIKKRIEEKKEELEREILKLEKLKQRLNSCTS